MPELSVVIPTYNRAHLLDRAIKSVLAQSFQDFELIIIDDSSTDGTEQLVKHFHDERITYVQHIINKGGSAARNTGIQYSSGKYIAFLDSDDEWLPDKIGKQLKLFTKTPSLGLVYTGFIDEMKGGKYYIPNFKGNYSHIIFIKNLIGTTSSPLIRKECFIVAGCFDETLPALQDWDMWIRIAQHYEISFVPEALVRYYLQKDSITVDKKRVLTGYSILIEKYHSQVKYLPISLRSEYYFYMGKRHIKANNLIDGFKYFIKSFILNPLSFFSRAILRKRNTWN